MTEVSNVPNKQCSCQAGKWTSVSLWRLDEKERLERERQVAAGGGGGELYVDGGGGAESGGTGGIR